MESLRRIVALNADHLPAFRLDRFQEAVLGNLYLEFFLERCRVLITPGFGFIATGETDLSEPGELEAILEENRPCLENWRRYVLFNLALYTALLETNSYYLSLNDNLLICRFVSVADAKDQYILKLYTISADELPENYSDKIYLGRDRISMRSLHRPHFGLVAVRDAVRDQLQKVRRRLDRLVPKEETVLFESEYLQDLEESLAGLSSATDRFTADFPDTSFTENLDAGSLLDANIEIRDIKHILIEMKDTLREMESMLMADGHPKAARYVTKFLRDVTNDINFLMVKVNGRISSVVNRIDAMSDFS